MPHDVIHKTFLKDRQLPEKDRRYWRERSAEERLSAVEELRRQFGKFPSGEGYDGSQRLRRVLRIVDQGASGRKQDLADLEDLTL